MAPRANWKGMLKIGDLACPVALYTAASTSERIAFHMLNRATGNRLKRHYVDSETGKPVEREDQVKGYATGAGEYVTLDTQEIADAVPGSDKTLDVSAFLECGDIDNVYFDKPYYLAPAERQADEAFILIREGMRSRNVAALAQTVLFRRVRTLLIRAHGAGMIATTLHFEYEVLAAAQAFKDIPEQKIAADMLELAEHIIDRKKGRFDPSSFEDRYEAALAEVVKARLAGRKIKPPKPQRGKVIDLRTALRESAALARKPSAKRRAG